MDRSQLQELKALADRLMTSALLLGETQQDDERMTVSRITGQLWFLKDRLDSFPRQNSINESSPLVLRLKACRNAMVTVNNLFIMSASQCDNTPSLFRLPPKEWRDKLELAFEGLKRSANSLSLAIDAGQYSGSESATRQTEVITSFDQLAEQIRGASGQISLPNQLHTAVSRGFTVKEWIITTSEINSGSINRFRVVCPRAYSTGIFDMVTNTVKFSCLCHEAPHEYLLCYERRPGKCLLREEICLDGRGNWTMLLFKSNTPVLLTLSDIPSFYLSRIENMAVMSHLEVSKYSSRSSTNVDSTGIPAADDTQFTRLEWTVTAHDFPTTKVRSVTADSIGIKRTLCNPSTVMLKHYRMMPKLQTIVALPERHLRLVLEESSVKQRKEVLVTEQTRVCHEANPLGKLVVTLQDAVVDEETSKVNFGFDLRQDAEIFARYVTITQERLREYFFTGPMHGEQLIYSREYIDTTMARKAGSGHLMLIARPSKDHTNREYRVIISKDKDRRYICLKIKGDITDVAWRGLLESMEDIEIWVTDYDRNGRLIASLTTWETLTEWEILLSNEAAAIFKSKHERTDGSPSQRPTTLSNEGATFVKSGHERTADDWLGEIYKLIGIMKGDRNDRYERVKIAIIDSGLNDTVKTWYMAQNTIVYKDFTQHTRNDSWHGTCCAKIISDMYEDATLFIARIFERDHADEKEGPIRMAQAIDWAISPPNCVDIISISAGFRHYSKELDEAVTRARAAGILVVAAAANWQNTSTVAFPARHNLSTMCIYSTNLGNQSSSFNPEPRDDTSRFAILGEGFQHPDPRRNEKMNGTSMATAVAAGLAANIIDFSRQADNKSYIPRAQDVGKLSGMLSIFGAISNRVGRLKYVDPLDLLPSDYGSNKKRDRQRVREILSQAMERAN